VSAIDEKGKTLFERLYFLFLPQIALLPRRKIGILEYLAGPDRGYRDSLLETAQEAVTIVRKCAHS